MHDPLYFCRSFEVRSASGRPSMACLWVHLCRLKLALSGPMKHARSAHACRATTPHVRSRWKEHAPRRSLALRSLFWVPVVLCVRVVYTLVGLYACRSSGVKVRGAKEVSVLSCWPVLCICQACREHMHLFVRR